MKISALEETRISIPECDPGIGHVIRTPESADLIEGVVVRPFDVWPDDRGYFLEVARMGQGLAAGFPAGEHAGFRRSQLSRAPSKRFTIICIRPTYGFRLRACFK